MITIIKLAIVTCVFIIFDIATGFLKAGLQHSINSTILRQGLYHKLSELLAIAFSIFCEYAVKAIDIDFNLPMQIAVCSYIIVMESISILENIAEVNPAMMKFYGKYLKKLKGEEEQK